MATLVTDDFNRANGALGANWTLITNAPAAFTIVSNQALTSSQNTKGHGNAYTGAGWTGGPNQWAELKIIANPSGNDGGPVARALTSAVTYYVCCINNADAVALGGSQHFELFQVVAGVFTLIGSTVSVVVNANDVIRVEVQGTTIRGLLNGVQLTSGTNATLAAGNPGMEWWETAAASNTTVDSFAAGDFSPTQQYPINKGVRPAPFKPMGNAFRSGKYQDWR